MAILPSLAALHDKHPTAFPRPVRDRSQRQDTFGFYGFECGPGWYSILDALGAVMELHGVRATQVKEKFGGLRVYTEAAPDEVYEAIRQAEEQAWRTCEDCGQAGTTREVIGWLRTLCPDCYTAALEVRQ